MEYREESCSSEKGHSFETSNNSESRKPNETMENWTERLKKLREYQRKNLERWKQKFTVEEQKERSIRINEANKLKKKMMTEEEKQLYLERRRNMVKLKWEKMSEEERKMKRALAAERKRINQKRKQEIRKQQTEGGAPTESTQGTIMPSRSKLGRQLKKYDMKIEPETKEEREERLEIMRIKTRMKTMLETEEEREKRLQYFREWRKRNKLKTARNPTDHRIKNGSSELGGSSLSCDLVTRCALRPVWVRLERIDPTQLVDGIYRINEFPRRKCAQVKIQ